MKRYKIIKPFVISFLTVNDQVDCLVSEGELEVRENTIYYVDTKGIRTETNNTTGIIESMIEQGQIEVIEDEPKFNLTDIAGYTMGWAISGKHMYTIEEIKTILNCTLRMLEDEKDGILPYHLRKADYYKQFDVQQDKNVIE